MVIEVFLVNFHTCIHVWSNALVFTVFYRQSTPPHPPPISESTPDSTDKSLLSPADGLTFLGAGDSSQDSPNAPRPPARNKNKATKVRKCDERRKITSNLIYDTIYNW